MNVLVNVVDYKLHDRLYIIKVVSRDQMMYMYYCIHILCIYIYILNCVLLRVIQYSNHDTINKNSIQ